MKSILFFIESLDIGGAEAAFSNIVLGVDKSKFDITVVSERDDEFHTSKIRENCRFRTFIKTKRSHSKLGKIINSLIIKFSITAPPLLVRKIFMRGKYDMEVAFCEGYATKIIGAGKKSRCKRLAWVHTDLINYPWSEKIFGGVENEKKCYENFDKVVCVSETIRDSFAKKHGMKEKTDIIYNVVDSDSILKKGQEKATLPCLGDVSFVLIGNYKEVKGYRRFIKVCSELKEQGYKFTASIFGRGSHEELDNLVGELDLNDTVFLCGHQDNPYKIVSKADALICSSYAEGYSTSVTEAVILGKPVITTECSGMREIFGNKECGIICENSDDGLFEAIKSVLDNPEKLKEYAKNSIERSKAFSIEKRIAELEEYLEKI